ncbi:MAG: hypothetical protein A3G34_15510 [Candidatus Lindowbacteria bacterium RIFCSPLOWO2_12_FULL_62_27]|nr:MAG: hypothetical protein A3G34_15510 [Candidatus Lindowbacteria bacterium RIFCSPLOWO2_12_FULL_62_27]
MSEAPAGNRRFRKRTLIFAGLLLAALAYYGVPIGFLRPAVQGHLRDRYGLHVDVGSVRVSIRGLIVTGVTSVWPARQATLEIHELTLGWSPLKSLSRGRPVFERLKVLHPTFTLRLPASQDFPAALPVRSDGPPPGGLRWPPTFDLAIRRAKIHLMREGGPGGPSLVIEPLDAEIGRSGPGTMSAVVRLDSRELGDIELTYREDHWLHLDVRAFSLSVLTDILGLPQKLQGQISAQVFRDDGQTSGEIRVEGLKWSGPKEAPAAPDTEPADTEPVAPEIIPFIDPPLDIQFTWSGRWDDPELRVVDGDLEVAGVRIRTSGRVTRSRRLDADLEFYASSFDEPALERVSRHFHALRFLHAFLKTIESPSDLQAKMHLRGPLARPVDWRYEGLVDIRQDTFAYEPFLGQYSFLGAIEFNEHGVQVPEILIPFGASNLVMTGTAVDYATRTARLTLKGRGLQIGPMIQYYIPSSLRSDAPEDGGSPPPAGQADVDLVLTRFGPAWGLDGSIDFRRMSAPLRFLASPARAYGRMTFSGSTADGAMLVRLGSYETRVSPYVRQLFTPDVEYGALFKDPNISWDRLSRAWANPDSISFVPLAGRGEVTLKVEAPAWRMDGSADIRGGRLFLPPFSAPVDSVSGVLVFETQSMRLTQVTGDLAGTPLRVEGRSVPGDPRSWTLTFQTPELRLADLLRRVRPTRPGASPKPFEIVADVSADHLLFQAFDIPDVRGRFRIAPDGFTVHVDDPIVSEYRRGPRTEEGGGDQELMFAVRDSYPIRKLFVPQAALAGDIAGTVSLRAGSFADSRTISGDMDLFLDRLTFKKAPPMLKVLDLMRLSFTEAAVFQPFQLKSDIERGMLKLDLDQSSNVGRWVIRGRLGLDASYAPLTDSDRAFHVTMYPKENIFTRILHESKILDLFGGMREGIKLDFDLVGNYNNSNLLWTEEPFVSVIRGRVSELVPGFFGTTSSDTARFAPKDSPGVPPAPRPSP